MCCQSANNVSYLCHPLPDTNCNIVFTYFSQFNRHNWVGPWFEFIAFLLIFLFSTALNLLMVHLFVRHKQVRNWTNLLITAICLSRWVMSVTTPFLGITRLTSSWLLGEALCKLIPSLLISFGCLTTWLLCLLSLDRYKGIVGGQPIGRISRRRSVLLAVIVIVSGLMAAPSLAFFTVIPAPLMDVKLATEVQVEVCAYNVRPDAAFYHSYTLILSIVSIVIPLALSTFCYASIGRVVCINRRRLNRSLSQQDPVNIVGRGGCVPRQDVVTAAIAAAASVSVAVVEPPVADAAATEPAAAVPHTVRFGQSHAGQQLQNQPDLLGSRNNVQNLARISGIERRTSTRTSTSSVGQQRYQRDQRTFAILVLTVSLFCLMNLPVAVCLIVVAVDMIGQRQSLVSSTFVISVIVMSANAVVNPLLYIYAGERYREATAELIGSLRSATAACSKVGGETRGESTATRS